MTTYSRTQLPRPFLKWAGGKSKLISQYLPYIPKFNNYFEPFLGGGALFFYLQPKKAFLSDINEELINVYCCVRDRPEELLTHLKTHQAQHDRHYYYQIRATSPQTNIARAARFIYLNKTCFNGLYRENSQGKFNVPIGRYKNPKIYQPELLFAASKALQNQQIKHCSFENILTHAQTSNDFVYFDPPYYPLSSTSSFTNYSRHSFAQAEQIKLQQICQQLTQRGVKVMLSNSDCDFIRQLYSNSQFKLIEISAGRAINSKAQRRGKITELLIISY
ncbi:DNA adenine methylase [Oscillatoria salina]|uniref:DNA adenine methylase n=1 Tax=Oscillatoria salina TaxID=331517 RepID=UPI0013B80AC9|nr:DNA adenine methylase [Oscillatoria salina]MBZ8182656.1 DNA adenine methylase [Oscillatoria salina IIICB1]NET89880.1 DNA adenine methylase [Kamptonema sp. SIO1D9]